MTSLTYPDGRIVDQIFDVAGRLAKVSNRAAGGTPAYDFVYGTASLSYRGLDTQTDGIQYTAAGAPQSFILGNGVGQFNGYNSRLQPCHTMVSTPVLGGTVSALLAGTGPGNLLDRQSFYNSSASNPCGSEAGNNGNIWSITDIRPVGNSQSFSYDSLNRLLTAARSDGAYNHTYNYDSFGNMLLHDNLASPSSVALSIDQATNRLLRSHDGGTTWGDYSYDAGGNLSTTGDGIAPSVSYQYNANNQVLNINGGATASYLYDAMDQRVFKNTPSGPTDYIYFNNQPIAEKDQAGNWTDYIYANGQKIARVVNQVPLLHFYGTNSVGTAECGSGYQPLSYLVKHGDVLSWSQYLENAVGGTIQWFDNGGDQWQAQDGLGYTVNQDTRENRWVHRTMSLDGSAGHTFIGMQVARDVWTNPGSWEIWIGDVAITSLDGTVTTIPLASLMSAPGCQGPSDSIGVEVQQNGTAPNIAGSGVDTHYYLDDHLGTTQMELSGGGWPVWEGQFTPFGGEIVNGAPLSPGQPDGSSMHYKFTGKERDTESGLDYFGARYYASSMGRWASPDWNEAPDPVPYADLRDPQSLNLYSYVGNNPLSQMDEDGHCYNANNSTAWFCVKTFFKNLLGGSGAGSGSGSGGGGGNNGPADYWPNEFGHQVAVGVGQRAAGAQTPVKVGAIIATGAVVGPVLLVEAAGAGVASLSLETMNSSALNDSIGPTQRVLLREFLGKDLAGAESAAGREIPQGITPRTLEIYKEIARRVIARGPGYSGYATQVARVAAIEKALEKLAKK